MENMPPPPTPSQSSTSSIVALVLGILSLTCCGFVSGVPAIFIGRSEIKAVDEGRISSSNRNVAKIGMILGIIGSALSLLGILVYGALIAMGISAGLMRGTF